MKRALAGLAISLLVAHASAALAQPASALQRALDDAEATFQAAVAEQQRGNGGRARELLADAERRFRDVLRLDRRHPLASARLGAILYQMHRYAEARDLLAPLLASGPGDPEVRWQLALALEALGDTAKALPLVESAARDRANDFAVFALLGRLRERRGDFAGAADALARYASLRPPELARSDLALIELWGRLEFRLGRYDRAIAPLEECARREPSAAHLRNFASAQAASGHAKEALATLAGIHGAAAEAPKTLEVMAYAQLAADQPAAALQTLRRLRTTPAADTHIDVLEAATLARLGREAEARTLYQAALQSRPGDADAHAGLGVLLARTRAFEPALPHLQTAAALRSKEPTICAALGGTLGELGRGKEAIAEYRRCLSLEPASFEAMSRLAAALLRAGEGAGAIEEAIALFERALSIHRNDRIASDGLLNARRRRARLALEAAASAAPNARAPLLDRAIGDLEAAHVRDPFDSGVLGDLGVALLERGQPQKARVLLRAAASAPNADPLLVALYARSAVAAGGAAEAVDALTSHLSQAPAPQRFLRLELAHALLLRSRPGEAAAVLQPLAAHDRSLADVEAAGRLAEVARLLATDSSAAVEAALREAQAAARAVAPRSELRPAVETALAICALRAGNRDLLARSLRPLREIGREPLSALLGGAGSALLLAIAEQSAGNSTEASAIAQRALAEFGSDPAAGELRRVAGFALLSRATRDYAANSLGAAARDAHEAGRFLRPDEPALISLRAALAYRSGQKRTAVRLWRSLEPRGVPEALLGLGIYHESMGERRLAQDYYRRYVAAGGRDAERVARWVELAQRFSAPNGASERNEP